MNTPIVIGVCDDKTLDRQQLVDLIDEYVALKNEKDILIAAFSTAQELLDYKGLVALLFLDIELENTLGIDWVPQIRCRWPDITIIFISAYQHYFVYSHRLHVFQFLTKPFDQQIFFEELERFFCKYQEKTLQYTINFKGQQSEFPIYQIVYIEAALRHLIIHHSKTGRHEKIGQISKEEQQLKKYGFLRCHQSYLVNMRYIEKITNTSIHLQNPITQEMIELPISRGKQAVFQQIYQEWLLGQEV